MTNVQVRDATVTLNGLQLHYRDWGSAAAAALVLLHGRTSNARAWNEFVAAMAATGCWRWTRAAMGSVTTPMTAVSSTSRTPAVPCQ